MGWGFPRTWVGEALCEGARRLAVGRMLETPLLELLPVFGSFGAVKLVGDLRGRGCGGRSRVEPDQRRLRYALGELSALLRAAVVVEDHYGQIFAVEHVRGSVVADGLAELQIRWPSCRSAGRVADPLADGADRLLPDAQARRGMDIC
jgi:hypothetical protein